MIYCVCLNRNGLKLLGDKSLGYSLELSIGVLVRPDEACYSLGYSHELSIGEFMQSCRRIAFGYSSHV